MKVVAALFISLGTLLTYKCAQAPAGQIQHRKQSTKRQYVPDAGTAIKIAEAVWLPIYGNSIYKEGPFKAVSKDSIWIVEGSLPEGMDGGVAYIEINKQDGCIIEVTHGK